MTPDAILLIIRIGVLPARGHARGWGYGPAGAVGLIVVILLILLLTGRARRPGGSKK